MSLRRSSHAGFTLLELVLVMLIACTALAIAAPSMTGWRRGARLRNAAEEFIRLSRLAKTMAITNAAIYRLQIDPNTANVFLTVQQEAEFVKVQDSLARTAAIPEGGKIEIAAAQSPDGLDPMGIGKASATTIDFYPTGRVQPARVTFSDETGHSMIVECLSPSEDYHLVIEEAK